MPGYYYLRRQWIFLLARILCIHIGIVKGIPGKFMWGLISLRKGSTARRGDPLCGEFLAPRARSGERPCASRIRPPPEKSARILCHLDGKHVGLSLRLDC